MTAKLLVRQGGGAAAEVDLANLGLPDREGVPFFDHNTSLITMGQRWEQGTAALGSFMYIDPHATHTHQFRPHASVKLVEDASGDDYIIAWNRIEGGNDTRRRSTTIGGDEVEHSSIGLGDCNLDLRGLPFATEWVRPAEDSWDRLQALAAAKLAGSSSTSTLHRATTNITVDRFTNGHLVDATSPVELEAKTYPVGTGVEEILMDILEEWGKGWGVTLHHTGGSTHKCLLVQDIDDLAKFTSDLRISDVPSDWDPLDLSAPTLEPNWKVGVGKLLENSHVISGLISIYGGTNDDPRHLYVETGEAPEDWEIWIDVYNDDLAKSEVQAERRANNVLNDRKRPYTTNRPSILLLPEQVTLITAGQAIEVKSVVMNQGALKHEWVWRRIAQITWEPSVDGRWWAHLELDRPRGSRPRVGGSQPGSTSPDPPPEPTPDPGDTEVKYYSGGSDDPGGDTLNWTGAIQNGGGPGDGAEGSDAYVYKSTSPTRYQDSWAASAGTVYRISGYVLTANTGRLRLAFGSMAVGTPAGTWEGGILEYTIVSPVTDGVEPGSWLPFSAGPMTAPTGTVSMALGRTGSSVTFDEIHIYIVGDPAANDEFAVDFGDHPHDSPYYLPSDYVESRLDELEGDIPQIIDNLDDVDTVTTPPTDNDVLTWDDATEQWVPAAPGSAAALDDLTDVDAPTPADNDVLTWDNGAGEWVAAAPASTSPATPVATLLHSTGTGATPDAEFAGSISPFSAIDGGSGTVSLNQGSGTGVYDTGSRSGWVLMQPGTTSGENVQLKQDYTLPDAKCIVAYVSFAVDQSTTASANNEIQIGIAVNDNDTSTTSGTAAQTLMALCDTEASGAIRVIAFDGTNSLGEMPGSNVMVGGWFLRIDRSSLVYRAFASQDGFAWSYLGTKTMSTAANNVWLFANCAATMATRIVVGCPWFREGTALAVDPWSL